MPLRTIRATCAAAAMLLALSGLPARAAEEAFVIPPPAVDASANGQSETAVLAGGCFWGVQGVFQHVTGVTRAVSGYSGGKRETATYEKVSNGNTDHAEAVEITFDPKVISYGRILQIFFSVAHDPTQLNRQGPDHGTQYRSAIFTGSPEQERVAAAYVAQLDKTGAYRKPIVTRIGKLDAFYPAEQYHQDFMTLRPTYPYIVYNDLPKVENLKRMYPDVWRDKPVLVGTLGTQG